MEFLVPSLRVAVQERLTKEALIERLVDLEQLNSGCYKHSIIINIDAFFAENANKPHG